MTNSLPSEGSDQASSDSRSSAIADGAANPLAQEVDAAVFETLREALNEEFPQGPLPPALPHCHMTVARWLEPILKIGKLVPRRCSVLDRDLLYFSYGGLFYRPHRVQTERAVELPVGLVFSPGALVDIHSMYPFDSGAMATRADLQKWRDLLKPMNRFEIRSTAALHDLPALVRLLYSTNPRYLAGRADKPEKCRALALRTLMAFLNEDMSPDIDHRQRSIELLSERDRPLAKHLLWVGIPERNTARVAKAIFACTNPERPVVKTYNYTKNFNPAELASTLEQLAYADIIERFIKW